MTTSGHVMATGPAGADSPEEDLGLTLGDMGNALRGRWWWILLVSLLAGVAAYGATHLVAPTFTASTTFLPPQQSQGAAASALASLGSLAGLAAGGGVRSSGEQYVALMQSANVSDRLIDEFKLMDAYDSKWRIDARKELARNVRISLGKKDGLITVEVDDKSPQRAADVANRYVDELRRMSSLLAVTEAQQRRVFFERQLNDSRDRLVKAQLALQSSGFNPAALKAEPKAAAESYARLRADVTAAELRLQALRNSLTDNAPEVRQQQGTLATLRAQLGRVEQPADASSGPDFIGKYRDFKYQETLFELYARQFELARVDESREGQLIQVVDPATPPETKSKPRRGLTAAAASAVTALLLLAWTLLRQGGRSRARSAQAA